MPRCSCASAASCSCVIVDGKGTSVSGAGTAGNPYVIDAETAIDKGAFRVLDTPTVNMNLTGEGTDLEPLTLSADATIALTALSDVDDTSVPVNGEVPTWVDNHWEFQPAATAVPGAIAASNGLEGDGSAATPLKFRNAGIWGQGSLANLGADSTIGSPSYIDSNGQVRTLLGPISDLNLPVPSLRNPWADTPDWALTGYAARIGYVIQHWVVAIHRGTAPISGGSSSGNGNITNIKIGQLLDNYSKPFLSVATCGTGGGMMASFCVFGMESADPGALYLTAMIPGTTITKDYHFSFGFSWLTHVGTAV